MDGSGNSKSTLVKAEPIETEREDVETEGQHNDYLTTEHTGPGMVVTGSSEQGDGYVYTMYSEAGMQDQRNMAKYNQNPFSHMSVQEDLLPSGMRRPKPSNLPKKFKCAMCMYRTRYKSDLNRHVRKHAISTFSCDVCNMPFKTMGNVEFHKRKEHPAVLLESKRLRHSCDICSYNTNYSSDLTRHVKKHSAARYHCNSCHKPFMTSDSLVDHMRTVHDDQDQESVMDLSGKDMGNEDGSGLVADPLSTRDDTCHSNQEKQETPVDLSDRTSNKCGSENPSVQGDNVPDDGKESLGNLADAKNSRLEYSCLLCSKLFGRKIALQHHLRNVHREQRLDDDWIDYDQDDLQDNQLLGGNSKRARMKYQCHLCVYGTMYKATYDRHLRRHQISCHTCELCRMPFVTYGHLLKHKRDNHTTAEPDSNILTCAECYFCTEDANELKNHINKEHNSEKNEFSESLPLTVMSGKTLKQTSVSMTNFRPSSSVAHADSIKPVPRAIQDVEGEAESNTYSEIRTDIASTNQARARAPAPVSLAETCITSTPPPIGRYARLVSDFDDYASRPFACALCFYRTGDVTSLLKHKDNHLTGCNIAHIPETARFPNTFPNHKNACFFGGGIDHQEDGRKTIVSEPELGVTDHQKPQTKVTSTIRGAIFSSLSGPDPITPTFSVHYRKDKTNPQRPYLCLMCRKRFRHLTLLKQHFRSTHSELSGRSFQCKSCGKSFRDPSSLQFHYDLEHFNK